MWDGVPLCYADGRHSGTLNRAPLATLATLPIIPVPEQASNRHSQEGVQSTRITEIMTEMF